MEQAIAFFAGCAVIALLIAITGFCLFATALAIAAIWNIYHGH